MAITIIGDGDRANQVRIVASPLAELGAFLHVLTALDHRNDPWAVQTWADLPERFRAECRVFSPLWCAYRAGLLYPASFEVAGNAEAELTELSGMPVDVVTEHIGYALCLRPYDSLATDLMDESTRRWFRRQARGRDVEEAVDLLLEDAAAFRDRLVTFLRSCWEVFFGEAWAQALPQLRGEVEARRAMASQRGWLESIDSIDSVAPIATLQPGSNRLHIDMMHHGVVRLDQTPLLVIPSSFGQSPMIVKHARGLPTVMQYPMLSPGAPVPIRQDLLRRRLRALADPARARLCRALAKNARSTYELAEWVGMSAPEAARHLRALREAELVTTRRSGRYVFYTLDFDAVRQLGLHTLDVLDR